MSDELDRFLDGDVPMDDLSPAERSEAQAWERLARTLRSDAPGPAPAFVEEQVMARVRTLPASGPIERGFAWLTARRSVRISPLAGGLVAATVATLIAVPWIRGSGEPSADGAAEPIIYVQFVLEAPGALEVAVAGDFNEWDGRHLLEDTDGDGVWTGRVPLRPGLHEYMFRVDGGEWVTDPRAERYVDDGFGSRNAVVAVALPAPAA